MIPQERASRRHEKILDAALRVFARKGYRDAAVDDIASESKTSKGGVYFHFPGKQAIFLELLDRTASRLRRKIEETIESEPDPIKRADAALVVVLRTFASHRSLARLFMIEALGAGKEFHRRLSEIHEEFASIIKEQLDEAVRLGVIEPLDTQVAATAWFGALNEVVMRWLLSGKPARLHDAYEALRPLLVRSVGVRVPPPEASFERELRERLQGVLGRAREAATAQGRPVLASVTLACDPVDPVAVFERAGAPAAFWQQPSDGVAMVAAGEAWSLKAAGANRIDETRRAWKAALDEAVVDAGTAPFEAPVALGAFAFKPAAGGPESRLPDAALSVPRFLFACQRGEWWLTVSLPVTEGTEAEAEVLAVERELARLTAPGGDSHEPRPLAPCPADEDEREAWEAAVRSLLADIEAGRAEKVVLARTVRLRAEGGVDFSAALRRLASRYASCTLFAFAREGACFFGATPERLLRIQDGVVNVDALAGSISRGRDETEDREMASRLLHDPKELHEHKVVVSAIEEALAPLCVSVEVAPAPRIVSYANVHHLYTPVSALALPGQDIFEFVERLHPTPATGGQPREAALELIERYEAFDRGWYAGPCGWVDAGGNGEFVVAIRSALAEGEQVTLYAGCGIVAGSDPGREYEESNVKLQAMLSALGVE
ncbi:MAG TPA: isochorismate synthase [Dehalococcoidia bacterium]|nr:isochorismate synthase [Dehalococcoidia bacterium]